MERSHSSSPQDIAWLVLVPRRFEFTQPLFHLGERVKFSQGQKGDRTWETGRILGLKFDEVADWIYWVQLDSETPLAACGVQEVTAKQSELQLVSDSCSIRSQMQTGQIWFYTAEAAAQLGISEVQLRKLGLSKRFRSGHHYRDISLPNSGLPRYQWHVARCAKTLESLKKR